MESLDGAPPPGELHLWWARLDRGGWPGHERLPAAERERAERMTRPEARRRWAASRWALRGVLARYLEEEAAAVELRLGERGKPMLADPAAPLRFNLSHSGELAVVAATGGREVGVDVQRLGRRPAEHYAAWARREAIAKCHGVGLGAPLPDEPVTVSRLDAGEGFAGAIAVAGEGMPRLRHFAAEPAEGQ